MLLKVVISELNAWGRREVIELKKFDVGPEGFLLAQLNV
jgi:hypothetical protein